MQRSPDVLVIAVPKPSRYASSNAISDHGSTHGKKSLEYLELFRSVREAARHEMERTGWTTWDQGCDVTITLYHSTNMRPDCSNTGKVEADSLEPSTPHEEARDKCASFPGVYTNDKTITSFHAYVEPDPNGEDRIVIIVRKKFSQLTERTPKKKRAKNNPPIGILAPPRESVQASVISGKERPGIFMDASGKRMVRDDEGKVFAITEILDRIR